MNHATNQIAVQHIADGEYRITRGGSVYFRAGGGVVPADVRRGDTFSAATICEWRELGVAVTEQVPA